MFLKFRYRLGYETLCREVADSLTGVLSDTAGWPDPAPDDLDQDHHPVRPRGGGTAERGAGGQGGRGPSGEDRVRVDTPVVEANIVYPTDSVCRPRPGAGSGG